MSARALARCPRCRGSGKAPLPPHLAETLAVIGRSWASSSEVRDRLGATEVARTALANRLARLAALGLVERGIGHLGRGELEWRLKPGVR